MLPKDQLSTRYCEELGYAHAWTLDDIAKLADWAEDNFAVAVNFYLSIFWTREDAMPKVAPFHSCKEPTRQVYHDNSACTEGNNIEEKYKRSGTDGRPRCERCNELAAQGK